jgi:exonuclease SbcD
MHYSGSPLAYAFDEAGQEKVFLRVEIDTKSPLFPLEVTPIPVRPLRKVSRLSGPFEELYSKNTQDSHREEYLEITLTDAELVANPMHLLRSKFPYLLSLRQASLEAQEKETRAAAEAGSGTSLEERDALGDYRLFQHMLYGTQDPEKEELFQDLLKECGHEA